MKPWSGTPRRLFVAFASIVAIFGAASYFAMAGLTEIHEGLHAVKHSEEGVRAALELASAVRDQYAHQAHTIIIGNETHLGMYEAARQRVQELTRAVRAKTTAPDELAWVDEIERTSGELDAVFKSAIVPAVLAGDRATIQREHNRAQELVSLIQDRADQLARRHEESIGDFEEHAGAVQHTTLRYTLFLLIASMVFAAAVAIYIGQSIVRPVAKLEAGAARLAQGDLSTHIEINSKDEFGRLAQQFNAMTAALKGHQEALVQSEKLAGIGRLAAGVAHEINNPLAVILGYVRLLRKKADGPLDEDLKIVEDEAVRCQQIVEELLDLSRPLKIDGQVVDLREVCDEVVARLRDAGRVEQVAVSVEGAAAVEGHPQKLRQVILNLITNAAEAVGERGAVNVRIEPLPGDGVVVAVEDTGPGIAEADRGRLFEPFFTTKPSGTGLGLAVSQAIAHAHGGEIVVETAPGGGAVFKLRLPRAAEGVA